MSSESAVVGASVRRRVSLRSLPRPFAALRSRPELAGLIVLAGVLNLWGLSINGWANTYYAAAVRSMTTSWHDFLFIALDKTGLMTVDKPPWPCGCRRCRPAGIGLNSLSILIPQALMGVAAVSRHNNPDGLLVLCCVAAIRFTARALETERTKWLVGHAGRGSFVDGCSAWRSWPVPGSSSLVGCGAAIPAPAG